MFILNNRQKNSKDKPVLTAVPFNDNTRRAYKDCAATKLKAIYKRRKREGAKPQDCIFINVRSKGPLSTRIANTRIQQIMALKMQEEGKPKEWNKFYTLKSARKAVASHMEHLGCAPQTVALQMKHASIQSQMSYVCKCYKKRRVSFESCTRTFEFDILARYIRAVWWMILRSILVVGGFAL